MKILGRVDSVIIIYASISYFQPFGPLSIKWHQNIINLPKVYNFMLSKGALDFVFQTGTRTLSFWKTAYS